MANEPSVNFLRDCLSYNSDTGVITWLPRPISHFATVRVYKTWHSRFCGKSAGGLNQKGYIEIGIQGLLIKAHRIAWALTFGEFPKGDIDHINGIRHDNRIVNLRDVDRSTNCRNSARPKNNHSGICGVYWRVRDSRWVASINFGGTQQHLGYFKCLIDAVSARKSAEIKYGYHENHGRK
ncbi:MAG: HNH endonuclease [Serratia sp.]|nr:HNH endonuclease [Serratia sp. (in: enterobacteria)]